MYIFKGEYQSLFSIFRRSLFFSFYFNLNCHTAVGSSQHCSVKARLKIYRLGPFKEKLHFPGRKRCFTPCFNMTPCTYLIEEYNMKDVLSLIFHLYHHNKVSVTPFRPEAPLKQTVQTIGVFRCGSSSLL